VTVIRSGTGTAAGARHAISTRILSAQPVGEEQRARLKKKMFLE